MNLITLILAVILVSSQAIAGEDFIAWTTDYGAVGDGAADDTAALQAAIDTGKVVRCRAGDTYLVGGGLVASAEQQIIDMSLCSLRLKDGAGVKYIIRLNGARQRVRGGKWDMNKAGNPETSSAFYDHTAVLMSARGQTAEEMTILNSKGMGIKGIDAAEYAEIRFNRIENTERVGIYFEMVRASDGPDRVGPSIHHNVVDTSQGNVHERKGIAVMTAAPFVFAWRRSRIESNEIIGPDAPILQSTTGITYRGYDGLVRGNHVTGHNIGISMDLSTDVRSIVASNRLDNPSGPYACGIEYNGSRGIVTSNIVRGGKIGICGSSNGVPSSSMDYNIFQGNLLEGQTTHALSIPLQEGRHANYTSIMGNTIIAYDAQNGGIHLRRDLRFSQISNNIIRGPGSSEQSSTAIFLDEIDSDIDITGNNIARWSRGMTVYSPDTQDHDRINFIMNSASEDMPSALDELVVFGGNAIPGADFRILGNMTRHTLNDRTW